MPIEIAKYAELDVEASKIAIATIHQINKVAPGIESKMPYKAQYILEKVIEHLQGCV